VGFNLSYNEIRINEQVRHQRMLEDMYTPWGRVTMGGLPWHFSRTPGEITNTPRPGEYTAEVLATLTPATVGAD
jgi:crotonobetainyl-CoA:carnitine CoA-transferase CaiB-like acyl-CoA transferase